MGLLCCYFRPKMFSPGDHVRYPSHTLGHCPGPLKYPCNLPPPGRPSRAHPGVCKRGGGEGDPALVVQYLHESTEWLKTKRQWRAPQMCWSIHKTDKGMDRVGKATDYNFSVISHAELVKLITFSLCSDNFCWAASSAWQRLFAIPIGGSFNAQCADLYCIWAFHWLKACSRQWGELTTSPCEYPVWTSPTGRTMALAQFRDNVLIASARPRATTRDVCQALSDVWKLPVLWGRLKRSARAVQLFGRLAVLETHTLRY